MFKHANAIEDKSDSREVRQNRVGKPYGWDSIELGSWNVTLFSVQG